MTINQKIGSIALLINYLISDKNEVIILIKNITQLIKLHYIKIFIQENNKQLLKHLQHI